MTSASAVMKVFMAGLRRRLTFTVPALAEIEREQFTPLRTFFERYLPTVALPRAALAR